MLTGLLLLLALLAATIAWDLSAAARGRLVGLYDLRQGRYEILTYGLPPLGFSECIRHLRERYGIQVRPIAGCVVSKSLMAYADAHNSVILAEFNRKLGRDVWQDCVADTSLASTTATAGADRRGWLVGTAAFIGEDRFFGAAGNAQVVIACEDRQTTVRTNEHGDYGIQLEPCKYRLVDVVGNDGKKRSIHSRQARTFIVKTGATTRFDVMISP